MSLSGHRGRDAAREARVSIDMHAHIPHMNMDMDSLELDTNLHPDSMYTRRGGSLYGFRGLRAPSFDKWRGVPVLCTVRRRSVTSSHPYLSPVPWRGRLADEAWVPAEQLV